MEVEGEEGLMMDEKQNFEVNKIKYQEARNQERHLSAITYVALGLFVSIFGAYIGILSSSLVEMPTYTGSIIGFISLVLLIIIAKISRTAYDNSKIIYKFQELYLTELDYNSSSVRGIGNYLQFFLLTLLTVYSLLSNQQADILSLYYFKMFILFFVILFLLVYYILAAGKLPIEITREWSPILDNYYIQWIAHIIIFFSAGIYFINTITN